MSGIHVDQTTEKFSHDWESSDVLYLTLDSLLIVRSVSIFYIRRWLLLMNHQSLHRQL